MTFSAFYNKRRNVILYGIIGVSAMVVDVVFFLLFFNVLLIPPTIATVLSVSVAMVYAFSLNAIHNFKTKDLLRSRFASYAVVSMLGMLASAVIIKWLTVIDLDPNIAKVISLPPIVILQYILNKTFAFKETVVLKTK
jgi:putative flippase GtrA